jgi:hypothetical protein
MNRNTENGIDEKDGKAIFNSLCWLVDCAQKTCDTAEHTGPLPAPLQKYLEDLQQAIKKAKTIIFQHYDDHRAPKQKNTLTKMAPQP